MCRRPGHSAALVLALGWLAGPTARAEPITLPQAARLALEQFPSVAAARAERESAAAESAEVRALFRPTVSFSASASQLEKPAPAEPIHGFRPDLFPPFSRALLSPRLSASYTLFDGGMRRAWARQAEARVAGVTAALVATEQQLLSRVAQSYLVALSLAEVLAADEARLAALEAERARARELAEAGKAAAVEPIRAEAALAAALAERAGRRARLDQAERTLARQTGLGVEDTRADRLVPLRESLSPLPERRALEAQGLTASPLVATARERVEAARAAIIRAKAARRPTIQASAQETGYGSGEGDFSAEWSAGVAVYWPLATGGAVAARVAGAEAALAAAQANLRLAELTVLGELDAALSAVAEAEARGLSLETAVRSFSEVVRVERLRLTAEAGTQSEYLDAEADLLAARAARAEARSALASARVEVARVVGALSVDWLERNLSTTASQAPEENSP